MVAVRYCLRRASSTEGDEFQTLQIGRRSARSHEFLQIHLPERQRSPFFFAALSSPFALDLDLDLDLDSDLDSDLVLTLAFGS